MQQNDYTFEFPSNYFSVIGAEAKRCREQVVAFDMSYFGKFYLSGRDAQAAADWLFTNHIGTQPGSCVYTCMLNHLGGIEADLCCTVLPSGTGNSVVDPVSEELLQFFYYYFLN